MTSLKNSSVTTTSRKDVSVITNTDKLKRKVCRYRYCFVPHCESGRRSARLRNKQNNQRNPVMFGVPRDPVRFAEWKQAVSRTDKEMTPKHVICEHHFEERYLERYYRLPLMGGRYQLEPRSRPALKSDAKPTVFRERSPKISRSRSNRRAKAAFKSLTNTLEPLRSDETTDETQSDKNCDNSLTFEWTNEFLSGETSELKMSTTDTMTPSIISQLPDGSAHVDVPNSIDPPPQVNDDSSNITQFVIESQPEKTPLLIDYNDYDVEDDDCCENESRNNELSVNRNPKSIELDNHSINDHNNFDEDITDFEAVVRQPIDRAYWSKVHVPETDYVCYQYWKDTLPSGLPVKMIQVKEDLCVQIVFGGVSCRFVDYKRLNSFVLLNQVFELMENTEPCWGAVKYLPYDRCRGYLWPNESRYCDPCIECNEKSTLNDNEYCASNTESRN